MRLSGWVITLTTLILILTYLGVTTSLTPILSDLGLTINPETLQLQSADVESSEILDFLFGLEGLLTIIAGAGAVTIGLYVTTRDTNILIVPLIVFIATTFASTFWSIIKLTQGYEQVWLTSIVSIIFGALFVGFIMSCADYFRGQ